MPLPSCCTTLVLPCRVSRAGLYATDRLRAAIAELSGFRDRRCADGDAGVHLPIESEVSDRAGVRTALILLELGDALHRADLRRARDGARREARAERVERVESVRELALDDGGEMHH